MFIRGTELPITTELPGGAKPRLSQIYIYLVLIQVYTFFIILQELRPDVYRRLSAGKV